MLFFFFLYLLGTSDFDGILFFLIYLALLV